MLEANEDLSDDEETDHSYLISLCCDGNRQLEWACQKGHVKVVKALTKHCTNIQPDDKEMSRGLYVAAEKGYIDVVKTILESDRKTDLNWIDMFGRTALSMGKNDVKQIHNRMQVA